MDHTPATLSLVSFLLGSAGGLGFMSSHKVLQFSGHLAILSATNYIASAIAQAQTSFNAFIDLDLDFRLVILTILDSFILTSFYSNYIPSFIQSIGHVLLLTCLTLKIAHSLLPFLHSVILTRLFNEIQNHLGDYPLYYALRNGWLISLQLFLFSPTALCVTIYTIIKKSGQLQNKPFPPTPIVEKKFRGIFKLPLLDGIHSQQNISLYAFGLGGVSGVGMFIALCKVSFQTFGIFLVFLGIFHLMEYYMTALYQENVSLESFLINHSFEYHMAMAAGVLEYFSILIKLTQVQLWIFPWLKQSTFITRFAILGLIVSQFTRSLAMYTAQHNFTHLVQFQHKSTHRLVTDGVYSVLRHPAYTAFFYWAILLQVVLMNPICIVGYYFALRGFFKDRIEAEEQALVKFFGQDYIEYSKKTRVFIPY